MSDHGSRCMYCAGSFRPGGQCPARTSPVGPLPCEAVMDVAMRLEALVDGDRNGVARLLAQGERDPVLQAVVSSWKQSGEVTHGDLLRAIRDLSEELCRVRLVCTCYSPPRNTPRE